jgi:hypothetical protein
MSDTLITATSPLSLDGWDVTAAACRRYKQKPVEVSYQGGVIKDFYSFVNGIGLGTVPTKKPPVLSEAL